MIYEDNTLSSQVKAKKDKKVAFWMKMNHFKYEFFFEALI